MKKIIAILLMFALLSGNINYAFAQNAARPQTMAQYAERYQTKDKPVFIKAGIDSDTLIIGGGITAVIALIFMVVKFGGSSLKISGTGAQNITYKNVGLFKTEVSIKIPQEDIDIFVSSVTDDVADDLIEIDKYMRSGTPEAAATAKAMEEIDATAVKLGGNINKEAYATLKTDLYELALNQSAITEEQKAFINTFKNTHIKDYSAFLSKSPDELAAYNAARESLYSYLDKTGPEKLIFGTGRDVLYKVFLKRALVLGGLVVGLSLLSNGVQAKVQRLALNPELAFNMDPKSASDAEVFKAVDNIPVLKDEMAKNFNAVHGLAGIPEQDIKNVFNFAAKQQKEKNKEINFNNRDMKQEQQKILNTYGANSFRGAK